MLGPTIHLHTREAHIFINYSRHICLGHSLYLLSTDLCYLSSIWAHSARRHYLVVPRHNLSSYGHREFAVAGPTAWNSLSDSDHQDRQFQTSAYNWVVSEYCYTQPIRGKFTTYLLSSKSAIGWHNYEAGGFKLDWLVTSSFSHRRFFDVVELRRRVDPLLSSSANELSVSDSDSSDISTLPPLLRCLLSNVKTMYSADGPTHTSLIHKPTAHNMSPEQQTRRVLIMLQW